jgi:osmotically-inducible protein OsmY
MSLKHIGNVDDYDILDALNAFVRSATPNHVSVEFADGVASLYGSVPSAPARRALEDLVMAHEGVVSVVNNIVLAAGTVPQRT